MRHTLEPIVRDWQEAGKDEARHLDISPALLSGAQLLVERRGVDLPRRCAVSSPRRRPPRRAAKSTSARSRTDVCATRRRSPPPIGVSPGAPAPASSSPFCSPAFAGWQWRTAQNKTLEAEIQTDRTETAFREAQAERDRAEIETKKTQTAHHCSSESNAALTALSRVAFEDHRPNDAVKLGLAAWPRQEDDDRPRLEATLTNISRALSLGRLFARRFQHDDFVNGAVLTKDESRILSWSGDEALRLWDVATGQQIGRAMKHHGRVGGAVVTKNESRILSSSDDSTFACGTSRPASRSAPP